MISNSSMLVYFANVITISISWYCSIVALSHFSSRSVFGLGESASFDFLEVFNLFGILSFVASCIVWIIWFKYANLTRACAIKYILFGAFSWIPGGLIAGFPVYFIGSFSAVIILATNWYVVIPCGAASGLLLFVSNSFRIKKYKNIFAQQGDAPEPVTVIIDRQ